MLTFRISENLSKIYHALLFRDLELDVKVKFEDGLDGPGEVFCTRLSKYVNFSHGIFRFEIVECEDGFRVGAEGEKAYYSLSSSPLSVEEVLHYMMKLSIEFWIQKMINCHPRYVVN